MNKTGTVQVDAALKAHKFNRGRGFMLKIKKKAVRKKIEKSHSAEKIRRKGLSDLQRLFYYLEAVK